MQLQIYSLRSVVIHDLDVASSILRCNWLIVDDSEPACSIPSSDDILSGDPCNSTNILSLTWRFFLLVTCWQLTSLKKIRSLQDHVAQKWIHFPRSVVFQVIDVATSPLRSNWHIVDNSEPACSIPSSDDILSEDPCHSTNILFLMWQFFSLMTCWWLTFLTRIHSQQ